MKKDKRTKAQLLEEISILKAHVKQLENRCDEIRESYETDGPCRNISIIERKLKMELSNIREDNNVFKDSLKFILRNVKQ